MAQTPRTPFLQTCAHWRVCQIMACIRFRVFYNGQSKTLWKRLCKCARNESDALLIRRKRSISNTRLCRRGLRMIIHAFDRKNCFLRKMTDSLKKPDIFFFNSVRLKRDVSKKKTLWNLFNSDLSFFSVSLRRLRSLDTNTANLSRAQCDL